MVDEIRRCEWCGAASAEAAVHPIETRRGWLTDPFHKRDPQFFACSETCKSNSETFYMYYFQTFQRWIAGFALIFAAAFGVSIPGGYPVFRWAVPGAIALGGILLIRYPFYQNFRRDKTGSLKTPLAKSRREGIIAGILFIAIAFLLVFMNTQLPSDFLAQP